MIFETLEIQTTKKISVMGPLKIAEMSHLFVKEKKQKIYIRFLC